MRFLWLRFKILIPKEKIKDFQNNFFSDIFGDDDFDPELELSHFIKHSLEDRIKMIGLALNLAAPGCFLLGPGYMFKDGDELLWSLWDNRTRQISNIFDRFDEAPRNPFLDIIPYSIVFDWLRNFPVMSGAKSTSRTERAIIGVARVFSNNLMAEKFFWSMYGLEALFVERHALNDLKSRLPMIFKSISEKEIDELYNFRSRIFHGNFNGYISGSDDFKKNNMINNKNYTLAYDLFIGSVQFLIKNSAFEYKLFSNVGFNLSSMDSSA